MANNTRETLIKIIKEQLQQVINNDESVVGLEFIVTDEFNKHEDELNGNEVFVVVKLGTATLNYNSGIYPASINVICNQNYTQEILKVFTTYAETYNLAKGVRANNYIIQSYTTPTASQFFDPIGINYGVVCYFNAGFSVSPNISAISTIKIANEDMAFITANFVYSNSVDAVSRPMTHNAYSQSIAQFGTLALTMTFYFNLASTFISELITMADNVGNISQDKAYNVVLGFSNSTNLAINNCKVSNFSVSQSQDGLPIIQVSMTQ